jgi:hypothetical protein
MMGSWEVAQRQAGLRRSVLRCPANGVREEADAFVFFLMRRLRETVNHSRPRSQLLGLCAKPAQAEVARLVRSLDARVFITNVATRSFALEGHAAVHDFVCRFDCARDVVRVLMGRIQLGPHGWQLLSLHQLPAVVRSRTTV